jgi:NAD(P)-dependent dehydrogenase (short-subunit alcohol dehydrogenase family)
VKDSAFCKQAVEQTVRRVRPLDILVNNAAFQLHAHSLEDITDERLKRPSDQHLWLHATWRAPRCRT